MILLRLKHYPPLSRSLQRGVAVTFVFPDYLLLHFVDHSLGVGRYWQAEKVLEVYLREIFERGGADVPYYGMQDVAELVQDFAMQKDLDDEQELWAKIGILQTFCEGVLNRCSLLDGVSEQLPWSFPSLTSTLQELMNQALLRDKSGQWPRSRASIRQKLIELDRDFMAHPGYEDDAPRQETLLQLLEVANANQDSTMVSLINERRRLLGKGQEPPAAMGLPCVPYQVYAKRLKKIERLSGPKPPPVGLDLTARFVPGYPGLPPEVPNLGRSLATSGKQKKQDISGGIRLDSSPKRAPGLSGLSFKDRPYDLDDKALSPERAIDQSETGKVKTAELLESPGWMRKRQDKRENDVYGPFTEAKSTSQQDIGLQHLRVSSSLDLVDSTSPAIPADHKDHKRPFVGGRRGSS